MANNYPAIDHRLPYQRRFSPLFLLSLSPSPSTLSLLRSIALFPHVFNHQQFQFRSATSLTCKPILSSTDPGRSKPTNAFSDTDPDFHLLSLPSHNLILNKYCVVRPQLILHTTEFVPQADHLTASDLAAAWDVLSQLQVEGRKNDYVVIYNCGFEGGSSVGHKHLQILPRPSEGDGFKFFPDLLGVSSGTALLWPSTFNFKTKIRVLTYNIGKNLPQSLTSPSDMQCRNSPHRQAQPSLVRFMSSWLRCHESTK